MKIPILNYEINKSGDVATLVKKANKYDDTAGIRPGSEFFNLIERENALVPTYASDLQRREMQDFAKLSAVYRQVITSLQQEIFRKGAEFKEAFVSKCTNPECLKEFDFKATECDDCQSPVRAPDKSSINTVKKFFKKVNENGDSILDVCKQLEFDIDTLDDAFMGIAKDYFFREDGSLIGGEIKEIFRIDPTIMFLIADRKLRMGRNPEGKKVFVCPAHRNTLLIEKNTCHCGKTAFPAFYQSKSTGEAEETIYYMEQEVIHFSKFNPSLTYGYPPFLSLYQKVMIELNMDWYVRKSYEKGRPPSGWLFLKTSNTESLKKMVEWVMEKLKVNPHFIYPIGVDTDTSGNFANFVNLMNNMQEMQAVEFRNMIKREIGALFGVMPLFQGDMSTSGGLNNEGLQVTVTNRATEVGQAPYNDKVFPRLMEMFGVIDYRYELLPSEEKDEMAELQRRNLELQNANVMLQMGFDTKMNEDGEFEFSGEATMPLETMPAAGGADSFGGQQGFSGQPASTRKSIPKAARQILTEAKDMEKGLEEMLKEFVSKLDIKRKPVKGALLNRISKLIEQFEKRARKGVGIDMRSAYLKTVEEVEKELNLNLIFGSADKNAIDLLVNSKPLTNAYEGMTVELSKKLNDVIDKAYTEPEFFTIDKIVTSMKGVADEEEYRLRTIARTETHNVSNAARMNSYLQADETGKFRYKWIGPSDKRTTDICKEIKSKTKGGVPLTTLKEMTTNFLPHINCRHTFVKVI